jgi:hypothetical protein
MVMGQKQEATVATTSLAHQAMSPEWYKMTTLLAGTQAMRDAGREMAPQHEHESDPHYDERIAANVLFNVADLTLRTWVGKPFSASVQLTEDFTPELIPMMDDIDLMGNNLDVFCRDWFSSGVSHALSHVMVTYPRVEFFDGRSKLDDEKENIRPYCVQIAPEDLIFAESTRVDGEEVLTHVRIREAYTYRDGWEEILAERIRVLDLEWVFPTVEGWDEIDNGLTEATQMVRVGIGEVGEDEKWFEAETFYMDIDYIPIVTFYADRTGFMTGKSPLLDLADLNIRWWQSMSDQISILTVTRFPILACSGGNDEDNHLVIGPKEWLFTDDPTAKFYYVEHNGMATKDGSDDLKSLEERMKSYGAEFMKKAPSRQTATARSLDSSEATSPLQDVVYRFNDALNQVMWYMAYWINKKLVGRAYLPTDFTSPDAAVLQTLTTTWTEGGLSDENYLKELQRRSVLHEHFDFEKNAEQLKAAAEEEAKKILAAAEAEAKLKAAETATDPNVDSAANAETV